MKGLLLPAVFFILAICVFLFYIRPAYSNIQELRNDAARFDQALDKANELNELRQTLLNRLNGFSPTDLARLEKLLPDNIDNVRLIIDIDDIAAQYGLQIRDFGISDGSSSGDSSAAPEQDQQVISQALYRSVLMDFSVTASYEDFIIFLQDLEKSLRIVDSTFISVAASGDELNQYSVSIRTYWLP